MSDLNQFLFIYEELINQITTQEKINKRLILKVLNCRDQIHALLQNTSPVSVLNQERLIKLDQQLRRNSSRVSQNINFPELRQSIQKSEHLWWWYLENKVQKQTKGKLDWLWKSLNVAGLVFNITLITDIASRFFIAGSTGIVGALTVALPSAITFLKANDDFQISTNKIWSISFYKPWVRKRFYESIKFLLTVVLSISIVSLYMSLSKISVAYSNVGFERYREGDIGNAERLFKKAIKLEQKNYVAHYNLGTLYERTNEVELAKEQYLSAIRGKLPSAYNNLARLYILENQAFKAIPLLMDGLKISNRDDYQTYSLLKNFGWARLQQQDIDSAIVYLRGAISIYESQSLENKQIFKNRGSAYCLMAKAMEDKAEAEMDFILEMWEKCIELGVVTNQDEDQWLIEARKKLDLI